MLEVFNQGWVGSLFGLIGVVVGVLGLIAYRRSRIGPRPVFQLHSRRLIGRKEQELPQEVEISFNGQPVPRLTMSRVVFWNSGNSTLLGSNIVQDDPVRLEFADGEILKTQVVKMSRDVVKLAVSQDKTKPKATITFDFLDPQDGAVIDILHTSEVRNPTVSGTMRGVPHGIASWGDLSRPFPFFHLAERFFVRSVGPIMFTVMAVLGILAIIFSLLPAELARMVYHTLIKKEWSFHIGERLAVLAFGLLYTIPPLTLLLVRRRRYPRSLETEEWTEE